jgi:hypothetical protein
MTQEDGKDWLSEMNPAPPDELATAMRNALSDSAARPSAEELLGAAERMLDKVLRTDCETRASALDLLTVDALITHAMLAASEDPRAPEDFAEQALRRVTAGWK